MSVYRPTKSRYFQYDFVWKGRRFHGSTGVETRRSAETVERRIRQEVSEGRFDPQAAMTLDDAAGRWWAERGQDLGTATDVERRLGTVLRLIGKNTRLVDITTSQIAGAMERRRGETYAKSKAKDAKRYAVANATVNLEFITDLRRILRRARTVWEVKGLHEIDWTALRLPEPDPEVRYYTAAQQEAWLGECDPTARFALQLLLTYALRLGELFFPPGAFDPGEGDAPLPRVTINKRKNKPHLLPLRDDDGRQVAARVGRALAADLPSIWFEESDRGELEPVTYYGMQARLRSAAKRAGIKLPRVIHGARHHAVTAAVTRGKNLKLGQQLAGHANIASTMRYAHALEDDLRALLAGESRNSPEPTEGVPEFVVQKQRRRH